MEASARRKVPGGKLLSVRLRHDGRTITDAELSGDFFLFPEESISILERALLGVPVSISEANLASMIRRMMEREGISAVGFGPTDLAIVVREALE